MTGKELLLVLAGTAAFAGVGGVGAALVLRAQPADEAIDQALLERLDRLDESLRETNASIDAGRDEITGLQSRMEAVESGLRVRRSAARPGRVDAARHSPEHATVGGARIDLDDLPLDGMPLDDEMRAKMQESLKAAVKDLGSRLQTGGGTPQLGTIFGADGETVEGAVSVISERLGNLTKAFELRRLPEEERWERARDEVGLNDVQVQEIQAAVAARDEAIRASMITEDEDEAGDGRSFFRMSRMDPAKVREANEAYDKRVGDVLNDQQKTSWKDGGFDNAFGNSASGSTTVISIGTSREVTPATR